MKLIHKGSRFEGHKHNCIWMQAGVVRSKFCEHDYNCRVCRFDKVMQKAADDNQKERETGHEPGGRRGRIISWRSKLRERPAWMRPCIHYMKGRITFRACTHEYHCGSCEFDQYFYDQYTVYTVVKPVDVLELRGFRVPQGYYLHRGHTWAKIEEGTSVRVGIDDFAFRLFGPFDQIEAPLIGNEVKQDEEAIKIFRGTHQASFLSPVSGVVTSTNPRLRECGDLSNQDPYSEGWVLRIYSNGLRNELKNLIIDIETKNFMDREVDSLFGLVEGVVGPLATDGGNLGSNIYGNMPQLGWERLTRRFLHT